jgi:hypothetical protein
MMVNTAVVNTAVFTCSICGEASSNICAYCTKDACSNHRCVRCKRCSDCCECEFPLTADEAAAAAVVVQPAPEPEVVLPEPQATFVEPDALTSVEPASGRVSTMAPFLTPEEASVFAEPTEPRYIYVDPSPRSVEPESNSEEPDTTHEPGE